MILMNKKRICFITTLPVTLKSFVCPQAEFLLHNGWDVTWVCAEDSTFRSEVPFGIKYISIPLKRGIDPFGLLRSAFALYLLFRSERFDIVQYSTPTASVCASLAAWLARVPVRLYAQWGIRYVGFDGIGRNVFKFFERLCCICSTNIEPDSLSNFRFSILEGLYTKDKGRVIWNGSASGVNLEHFDINKKNSWRTEYRKKIGLDSHHLIIGFVGSIRRDKGCNELIAACRGIFSDMPEVRLLLIGDKSFYDTIDEDLRNWVASSNQVIYIPPNSEIPQYMACMDVFSLPSYREGFGLVIVEAAAMGVPVVVSNVPGPIDAMSHNETGLVVPVKNVKALAAALRILLKDREKRLLFGASAAIFAKNSFEQNEFLQRVLEDKVRLLVEKRSAQGGNE